MASQHHMRRALLRVIRGWPSGKDDAAVLGGEPCEDISRTSGGIVY
jgi:hypothetical protein